MVRFFPSEKLKCEPDPENFGVLCPVSIERQNEHATDIRLADVVNGCEGPGFPPVIRREGNPGNGLFYGLCKLEDFNGELDLELFEPAGVHHDGQVVLPEDGHAAGIGPLLEDL